MSATHPKLFKAALLLTEKHWKQPQTLSTEAEISLITSITRNELTEKSISHEPLYLTKSL